MSFLPSQLVSTVAQRDNVLKVEQPDKEEVTTSSTAAELMMDPKC